MDFVRGKMEHWVNSEAWNYFCCLIIHLVVQSATVISLLQRFVSTSTAVRGELLFEMIVTHDEQCKVSSPTSRSDAVRGFETLFRGCRTACNYRVFCTKVVSNYRVCVVCIQFTWMAHTVEMLHNLYLTHYLWNTLQRYICIERRKCIHTRTPRRDTLILNWLLIHVNYHRFVYRDFVISYAMSNGSR